MIRATMLAASLAAAISFSAAQSTPAPPRSPATAPQAAAAPKAPTPPPPPAFQHALDMINRGQYRTALARLKSLPPASRYGDAALYWKAYALSKLDEKSAALRNLAQLKDQFANSAYLQDAAALRMELGAMNRSLTLANEMLAPSGPAPRGVSRSDELKLLAINGLMRNDPKKALPVLEQVIAGQDSTPVKRRALFVLAQSRDPGAVAAITKLAGSGGSPALQREAIRDLAITGHAGHLWAIYRLNPPLAAKREIIQALAISGDSAPLIQVAKTETNPALRLDAIRALGISSSPAATAAIASLYAGAADRSVSEAVIQAMFLHNNATGLVALARRETDPTLKREIVQQLSLMHNPAASAYLTELLSH